MYHDKQTLIIVFLNGVSVLFPFANHIKTLLFLKTLQFWNLFCYITANVINLNVRLLNNGSRIHLIASHKNAILQGWYG